MIGAEIKNAIRTMIRIRKAISNTDMEELKRVQDNDWMEMNHWGRIMKKIWEDAINKGHNEIIEILLKRTKFTEEREDHIDILTLMIDADMNDTIERVVSINRELTMLKRENKGQASALMRAVKHSKYAITETMLKAGASPDMFDMWDTPLGIAIDKNDVRMATLLLENNANPRRLHNNEYPHIFDVRSKEMLEVLLKSKRTSWNERDSNQKTFLHKKIEENDIELLEIGLKACSMPEVNINVNSRDINGRTPLHYVAEKGKVPALTLLIRYGAMIDAKDKHGKTPLLLAVESNNTRMVRTLLAKGADLKATDEYGKDAIEIAYEEGFEEENIILAYLLTDLIKDRYGEYLPHIVPKLIVYLKTKGDDDAWSQRRKKIFYIEK